MPPRVKVPKDMVANAAYEIVKKNGYENLNARTIAESLGCSTQPVLYHFKTVNEIREAAYEIADRYHSAYIMPKENDDNPLLSLGLNYVRFGYEEKNLFRFLFQTNKFGGLNMAEVVDNPETMEIIGMIADSIRCDVDEAKEVFLNFFCTVHGLASLLANNSMEYDEKQCTKMLENVFCGILAIMKGE